MVEEWARQEEKEGSITSFNESQGRPISGECTNGLWQSGGGLGGKSLDDEFNAAAAGGFGRLAMQYVCGTPANHCNQ